MMGKNENTNCGKHNHCEGICKGCCANARINTCTNNDADKCENTLPCYHTLLPRYLQDALKRAAQPHGKSAFERQCEIDRVALSAKTEYPKGFKHDN